MARPKKTALDYFPLDVDVFSDEKMVCIYGEFGIKGQVVALHLLCAIYRQGYFVQWDERLLLKIASATGLSADLVKTVVQRLVKWSFFDEGVFRSVGVLTSRGIQRRYFAITRGRVKKEGLPHLLISDTETSATRTKKVSYAETPVSYTETPVSYAKTPIKKSKVNKRNSSDEELRKTPPPMFSLEDEVRFFKADGSWCESLCMHFGISAEALALKFNEFATHCTLEAKTHPNLRDAKSHFSRWLNRNLYSSKPQTQQLQNAKSTGYTQGDAARQGFDIADFVARNLGK